MAASDDWEEVDVASTSSSSADEWEQVDIEIPQAGPKGLPRRDGGLPKSHTGEPDSSQDQALPVPHSVLTEKSSPTEPRRGTAMLPGEKPGDRDLFKKFETSESFTDAERARIDEIETAEYQRLGRVVKAAPRATLKVTVEQFKQMVAGAKAASREQKAADWRKHGPFYDPLDYSSQDLPATPEELALGARMAPILEESAQGDLADAMAASVRAQQAIPKEASHTESNVIQGAASGLIAAPTILASTAATGTPVPGVVALGIGAGTQRYAELRNLKIDRESAAASATILGSLEALTEFIPGETLVKRSPLGKKAVEFLMTDLLGENVSSVAQIADDYRLQLRDDVTLDDLKQSIEDTTVQTLAGGAVQLGIAETLQRSVDLANRRASEKTRPQPGEAGAETRPQPGQPPDGAAPVAAEEVLGPVQWEEVDAADTGDVTPAVRPVPPAVEPVGESAARVAGAAPTVEDTGIVAPDEFELVEVPKAAAADAADTVAPVADTGPDARLADEGRRAALEESRNVIGWEEVGGRLLRENGNEGAVTGRTSWTGHPDWTSRPRNEEGKFEVGKKAAHDALDRVKAGKKLTGKQERFVRHLLDEQDKRRTAFDKRQVEEAPRHEAEIVEAIPDFANQDDTAQEITRIAKVASQYATEDEVEAALEALDDREAIARLQRLVDRGWMQPEAPGETEPTLAELVASEKGLEPAADAGAQKPADVEGRGQTEVPSAEAGLTAAGASPAEDSSTKEPSVSATAASPPTDLFGTNLSNSDALNKRNAKVARKLGEGRAASPADKAPPGDMFRAASDAQKAEAAAAQIDIETVAPRTDEHGAAMDQAATSPTNDLPEPTLAQKEAGNYAKGHFSMHGLNFAIENPTGSWRWKLETDALEKLKGTPEMVPHVSAISMAQDELRQNATVPHAFVTLRQLEKRLTARPGHDVYGPNDRKAGAALGEILDKGWVARLAADYGYIKGYIGKDKDHLDVYVGLPKLAESPKSPVFVMDQKNAAGKFDEHKVFMGFENNLRVKADYAKSFDNSTKAELFIGKIRRFANVEEFKQWLNTGDLTKPVAEWKPDVQRPVPPAQQDRAHGEEPGSEGAVRGERNQKDLLAEPGGGRPAEAGPTQRQDELRDSAPAAAGERGDQPVRAEDGRPGAEAPVAGSDDAGAGADTGGQGTADDLFGAADPLAAAGRASTAPGVVDRAEKVRRQRQAEPYKVELTDRANIAKNLPFLLDGQHDDVQFAEKRHGKPEGYGVLFTNGTGTGKTYSGLGYIKRQVKLGKKNGLVVVPSQKIVDDWIKSAKDLGLEINVLEDTKATGKGIAITTYANFGANETLADRKYDWVVVDEAHMLMQNEQAEDTASLETLRAITMHPDGWRKRAQMLHRTEWNLLTALSAEIGTYTVNKMTPPEELVARHKAAYEVFQELAKPVQADVKANQGAKRPRAMFLSATPFAYEKNVRWAQGYLFEWGDKTSEGYNAPNAYEGFMIQHFGYRMRYNKLTEPDAKVDRTVMQRQFNTWLKQTGALSGRILEEPYDYDRKFVLIESKVGNKIDEGLDWIRKEKLYHLDKLIRKQFDFLARSRLLEALKAREAVGYIKAQHALGRKVVVFYDFNEGGGYNVFDVKVPPEPEHMDYEVGRDVASDRAQLREEIIQFRNARPDLVELDTTATSPLVQLLKAFPNAKQYNGLFPAKKRTIWVNAFNDDTLPQENLILAQKAANAGWSAHDTTGKHQRVLINLGLPTAPTVAIQQEGRIYRVGQGSDAMFRYFNTGTNWERTAFASTIARRASTAENLAMGELARGLRDSFIEAFQDSQHETPGGEEDGKGGKARDRALSSTLSEYDRAKSFYFANQKRTSKNKSREGADYFATPEPLGFKMVEWARPRPEENLLEPSAGHGAIARFFPELSKRTVIEPSNELGSRLQLASDAKYIQGRFEDHDQVNKYDVIVMNPPFGSGGSTAIEHLDKAFTKHLREGGRIVALIPEGPAADKKFEKWHESTAGAHVVAEYGMPQVAFERAGTGVKTRVLVIDKLSPQEERRKNYDFNQYEVANGTMRRDYVAEDINELFRRIAETESPPRVRNLTAEGYAKADEERAAKIEEKEKRKEDVKAAAKSGKQFTSVDSTHTKSGAPVYYAVQATRVSSDEYYRRKENAIKLGGYYSSFGAIKGFLFKAAADRDAFIKEYDGNVQFSVPESPSGWDKVDVQVFNSDGTPKVPMSRAILQAHLAEIAKAMPLVEVHTVDGFNGVSIADRGLLEAAYRFNISEDQFSGVVWRRPDGVQVIYLNARRIDSLSHAEEVLFHEATHRGIRAAIGEAAYKQLADALFVQMGGAKAFPREMSLYFDKRGEKFNVNEPDHRLRLVDEALAHAAQKISHGDTLGEIIERLIDRMLAWVNKYFRSKGWRRTFSRAEIKNAIRSAVQIGLSTARANYTVETPLREMAAFSAEAVKQAQRRRPSVKVTDEANFALRDDDRDLTERQHTFWSNLKKGQYIERAVRLTFLPPGLTTNEKGEWTMSPLGRRVAAKVRDSSMRAARRSFSFLRPLHDAVNREYQVDAKVRHAIDTVKQGLVDRWGTPPEFVLADYASKNYQTQILDRAKKMVVDLETSGMVSNRAEAEALQAMLTGETPANVDAKMAAIAEPIRQVIDQWGAEAVELGLLDKATFERNRATYLHRVYRKREADWLGVSGMVKRVEEVATRHRRKIIGNQFKRRGISFDVTTENLRKALPQDWWQRKTDGKKIDVALGESEWVVLSKVKNPREGTPDMLSGDTKGKDRVVDRAYWPADETIPPKFAGWRNDGTFKAIKVTPNSVTLWRDFSKDERMKMGEILDTRYTFLKTALTAAHDLATGRLYRDIAINPEWSRETGPATDDGKPLWTEGTPLRRKYNVDFEWTHVPDTTIPGTSTKRYGAMAGRYIRSSIWRDLNELEIGMQPGVWKWVLTSFKKNKTTRNPKTHFFNTMSNVILAYMDDMRFSDFTRGLKEWYSNGPMYEEARLHGVFGHDFVEQEIKKDVLRPFLERILKESNADGVAERKFKLLYRLFDGARRLDETATNLYQWEDEWFRMASYMQFRKQGMAPDEAAIHARRQFIDYDIRAPWVNALRYSVIPFISYTYRAIPRVMDAVAKRPWKIATLALLTYALNELAYQIEDDDDEELQRRLMNEHARGHTWAFTPRMLRLPMNDEYGNPVFLDMRNGLPAANIVDFENSHSAVPTPAWIQIGGPMVMGVDFMQNYDSYRQEAIADSEVDTLGQKVGKGAKFLWSSYMPSFAPGGYNWDRVASSMQGRMNQAHETSTIGMAVAQSVLPITVQSTEKNRRDRVREYERKLRALSEQAGDFRRDFQKIKDPDNDDIADLREALQEIDSRRDQVMRERAATLQGKTED